MKGLLYWTMMCALPAVAAPQSDLQSMIDATPPGGVLQLAPGVYQGPVHLRNSITLDGAGKAIIQGKGNGTVVTVSGRASIVRGLRIRGSGESHDRIDAGLQVEGDDHRIENNRFEDVLFGINLKQVNRAQVIGNQLLGKDLALGLRGDAIRLWYSRNNLIENNRFERARDLTFTNSPDNRFVGNQFNDGRYGMHIIFSPRLQVENNRLTGTGTGIVVLYSPGLTLRGNYVAHALTAGGAGIVFKDSDDALVEGNTVLHCAVGLKSDAPSQAVGVLNVRNNRFAHNIVGLSFYGEEGGHRFGGNRFENNLTTVSISAPGAASGNIWEGNFWDEYQGFDRDRNGVGDTPHEIHLFADRIWMETPMSTFFRNSPVFEMLDFLERLAPFSAPHRVLRDSKPKMH